MKLTERKLRQIIREELRSLRESVNTGHNWFEAGSQQQLVFYHLMRQNPDMDHDVTINGFNSKTLQDFSAAWDRIEPDLGWKPGIHPSELAEVIHGEMTDSGDDPEGMEDLPMGDDV